MTEITWTGNLDDDCTARVGPLTLRAECMNGYIWHTAVYLGVKALFDEAEHGGCITSGDMARAVCEAIAKAYAAGAASMRDGAVQVCVDFEQHTDDMGRDLLNGVSGSIEQLPLTPEQEQPHV